MRVAALAAACALITAACAAEATSDPLGAGEFEPITTDATIGSSDATFSPLVPQDPPPTSAVPDTTSIAPSPAIPADDSVGLVVAEEGSGTGYDRGLFEHWIDADSDGCDTHCEVLLAERRTDLPGIGTGWLSVYDWIATPSAADLDVDHLVPLAEAWRSGAHAWDIDRRRAFANDLDDPDALVAVTSSSNREKSDQDPANWRPPRREQWCWYATAWIRTKAKWQLTVDPAEAEALSSILAEC